MLNQSRAAAAILIVQFHFCLSGELVPEVHWDVSAETELCFDAGLDTLNLRLSAFTNCGHVGFELFFVAILTRVASLTLQDALMS